tara:strand:+ start:13881 stop:17831 length:3951 start_codon:yes stop_codon:yes gene_type:complete
MNTILITCSKDKASVNDDDGRFLNRVSNGVLVEKGDQISVEQIAINSIGVGSDIVEIPRELEGYDYYTNELNLKSAFYIHHNYEFTLQLPCILATQGLALDTAFNFIRPYEPPGGTGILPPQPFYGYMMGDNGQGGAAPVNNFQLLKTTIPKVDAVKTAGKRFWFVKATDNDLDPTPPNVAVDVFSIPTLAIYEFIDTNVPLSVDVGYDSPSNLAGKLTEDLHSTLLHPLQTPLDKNIEANDNCYELPNNNYADKELQSVSSNDGVIAVLGANFTRTNPRFPPGNGQSPGTPMYECIACLNPYLWIWGSRLLQGFGTKRYAPTNPPTLDSGMGWKNNYIIKELPGALIPVVPAGGWENDTYAIYNLYNLPRRTAGAVIYNSFPEGYVLMVNLCWTTQNVKNLAELIHSQMNYTGTGTTTANMTSPNERGNWIYSLPFGRCRDDASYLTPDITPALKPLLQAGAVTPLGGYGTGFENNAPELPVQGFFNPVLYSKAYLGADDIADGAVFPNPENIAPIYKDKDFDLNKPLTPLEAAKYYDVNLIPVLNKKTGVNAAFNEEVYIGIIINDYKNSATPPNPNPTLIEQANYCIVDLAAKNRKNPFVALVNPNLKATETTGVVPAFTPTTTTTIPAYTTTTPQPDLVTPQPDLVTPQPDLVTPQPDLVTPQPDLVTPQPDLVTPQPDLVVPQPDLVTVIPAVPPSIINRNNTFSGTTTLLTTTYDYSASPPNRVLGNSYEKFTDDGGLSSDYSTSHSRCIIYDAGVGNKIMINPVNFETEHSSFSMYDRIGITCSNTESTLNSSSSNLSNSDSTLSQYLYQSSSSNPSTFWGSSWTATNGGYGTGGGWIFPSSSGTDSKNNNNSGWVNTWYVIDARFIKIFFKSDGSATEPGWEFRIARQENNPGTPEQTIVTPQPDLIIPQPDIITPQPDLITPQPDLVTPQPDLITPQPDLVTPQPDLVTPQPDLIEEFPEETITNFGANPTADYVNTVQIGTPNPSLQFDSARGRFNFQNLHWDRFEGNKRGSSADPATTPENPSADVIVNALNSETEFFDSILAPQKIDTITLISANSGIGLIDVGLATKDAGQYEYLTDFREINKQQFWSESLLSRLGFDYKALFNTYGLPDSWFLTRTYQTFTKSKLVQYFPYPLTTNSVLDTTLAFAYDQTNTPTPYPMYNLSSQQGRWNVNASTSTAQIFASNLPQKLVFPFWLIYSDIIGGITFHSSKNGAESNIIAICNRSYVSGDFSYSFATDYVFTATKDFVITGITTQILNPDLTPADIDNRTTIVYKVTKPLKMFQEPPPSTKVQEKANLKQRTGR